jgi:anti-sigma regulatory factor (Ser/Thr protein kinase)
MTKEMPPTEVGSRHPLDNIAPKPARDALIRLLALHRAPISATWGRELHTFLSDGIPDVVAAGFDGCLKVLDKGALANSDLPLDGIGIAEDTPAHVAARLHAGLSTLCTAMSPVVEDAYRDDALRQQQFIALLLGVVDICVAHVRNALDKAVAGCAHEIEQQNVLFLRAIARLAAQNCLRLVPAHAVPLPEGSPVNIQEPRDVGRVRRAAAVRAAEIGMEMARADDLSLAVGEAVSNVLKHAGNGTAHVWRNDHTVFVHVSDNGGGITAANIPKALTLGWSSEVSLGMGFTLMLEMADALWLATGSHGTTVCIEKTTQAGL